MCNAHNHPPDCTCGWGGEGHLGGGYGGGYGGGLGYQEQREASYESGDGEARPSTCKYCGQSVYIYTNDYGSFVLFDELGWPWPKHECAQAPSYFQPSGRSFQIDCHIQESIGDLFPQLSWGPPTRVRPPTPQTIRQALKKLHNNGQFALGELLRMLLTHLKRDELAFPCVCGDCGASLVMLYVRDQPSALFDDIWRGQPHSCQGQEGRAYLPHLFTFRDFAWRMTGVTDFAGRPSSAWTPENVHEGLVVEIHQAKLKLLTSGGLLRDIPATGGVNLMDYLRISQDPSGTTLTERLALLRGGQGKQIAGWSRTFRFVAKRLSLG